MWLIIGLVLGIGLLALVVWVRNRRIAVRWYDWVTGGLGLGLLLFAIQNFSASLAEHEEAAAANFLRIFGTPAVFLLALFFVLLWFRRRYAVNSASSIRNKTGTNEQ